MVGETPKRYTLRLRLEWAAARLLASDDSIVLSYTPPQTMAGVMPERIRLSSR